jgi:hypothetical protein
MAENAARDAEASDQEEEEGEQHKSSILALQLMSDEPCVQTISWWMRS